LTVDVDGPQSSGVLTGGRKDSRDAFDGAKIGVFEMKISVKWQRSRIARDPRPEMANRMNQTDGLALIKSNLISNGPSFAIRNEGRLPDLKVERDLGFFTGFCLRSSPVERHRTQYGGW